MQQPEVSHSDGILILGTGALGTLFAARLARAGFRVMVLGTWLSGLDAFRQSGARLITSSGREVRATVGVTSDPAECKGIRYALVLVKAWQTARAATQLASCLPPDGLALTLQNGLGNREALAHRLGARRVALGSTTTGATLLGPGFAKAGGEGTISMERHAGLEPLRTALDAAGFATEVVDDARSLIWSKLVINSAINPLTALLRVPNGQLLERPTARRLLRTLALETTAVAAAEHVRLGRQNAVRMVEGVARRTATNHSSMFQDVQRGAPTEIDAICGAVARTAQRHGIPAPMNAACWQLVRALSEGPAPSSRAAA